MADGFAALGQTDFDWLRPDYVRVFQRRAEILQRIRADPTCLPALRVFYRHNIAQFITDFGCTFDPRNVERGLPALIPFILFPKQRAWVDWVIAHWRSQSPGLTEKSRDMGMSWLAVALACSLCLFEDGMGIGFGSRKEEYVDKIGHPKSLFWKARQFMQFLPREFRGGWVADKHSAHMRLTFPQTGSTITGEAGDNIGRGDRQGIYFVDEAAYLEHPAQVDAALSQTTNCQIDMSSVNGMANAFATKRWRSGVAENFVFIFDWRDDPRKNQDWYDKQVAELDPVIVAQEIDRDYAASVEGVIIPGAWVRSALDAHLTLGISISGERRASLDVADEGKDKLALAGAHGFLLEHIEEWSGKGADIFASVERAFMACDELGYEKLRYDADGLGAGVRGDARIINERRREARQPIVTIEAVQGSAAVYNPEGEDEKGRKNKDLFQNLKSQLWWSLRRRFRNIHRWVTEDIPAPVEDIICIASGTPQGMAPRPEVQRLMSELSQATWTFNATGKIVVDKTPDGARSPNMSDAVKDVMGQVSRGPLRVNEDALNWARR